MATWTLDDIPWSDFDPSKVDQETLQLIKAAALVENNGHDYAIYLCNVFHDDPEFQEVAKIWAEEEVQHGRALRRCAELADPSFDFDAAFKCFVDGYRIPLETSDSVRGSRACELVARCIVETGTSSLYTAIKEGSEEPVLKEVCRRIAADELRHYKLFYTAMNRYLDAEQLSRWQRLRVAAARMAESGDDELAFAYHAANHRGEQYNHSRCNRAIARRSYRHYRPHHVDRVVSMVFKAVGLSPQGMLQRLLSRLMWRFLDFRTRSLTRAAA